MAKRRSTGGMKRAYGDPVFPYPLLWAILCAVDRGEECAAICSLLAWSHPDHEPTAGTQDLSVRTPIARGARSWCACSHFRSPSSAGGGDLVLSRATDWGRLGIWSG
jgi:hypothetical protein